MTATPVADKDAVAALAEALRKSGAGFSLSNPDADAKSILAALPEGWRLSRVDETPPDALREQLALQVNALPLFSSETQTYSCAQKVIEYKERVLHLLRTGTFKHE